MDDEERIIKITGSGWSAKFSKKSKGLRFDPDKKGSLRLTNKRLVFKPSGDTVLLEDIEDVEIETQTADVTRIKIRFGGETEYISFVRNTPGHLINILIGDAGISHSEISSYTAYWASLITMATFMFGGKASSEEEVM